VTDVAGTYEEWRVTGQLDGGFPPYNFTWSPWRNPHLGDPEAAARGFVALIRSHHGTWDDGPHLSYRTVTVTDWRPVPSSTKETP
jgi:hypothetical protein